MYCVQKLFSNYDMQLYFFQSNICGFLVKMISSNISAFADHKRLIYTKRRQFYSKLSDAGMQHTQYSGSPVVKLRWKERMHQKTVSFEAPSHTKVQGYLSYFAFI